jgi:hypothetical protein
VKRTGWLPGIKHLTKEEHAIIGVAANSLRNTLMDGGEFYRLVRNSRADARRKRAVMFLERLRNKLDSLLYAHCPEAALPSPYYGGSPCLAVDGGAVPYAQHLVEYFDTKIVDRINGRVPAANIDLANRVHAELLMMKPRLQDEEDDRRWQERPRTLGTVLDAG